MRPDIDVRLVADSADVETFLQWLEERLDVPLAIDTETKGLDWWEPDYCRLWQIGDHESGWAIPVSWWGKVIAFAMERITEFGTHVVMHNAAYDMHIMETAGWRVPSWADISDTVVLMHLNRSDLSRALKGKGAAEVLGRWVYSGKDTLNKVAKAKYGLSPTDKWAHIPVDEPAYWAYGVMDTVQTRLMYDALEEVRTQFPAQIEREMRYAQIMYRAEKRGIRVDTDYTEKLQHKLAEEIKADLFYLQGEGLDNPNSNRQVLALLEEDYGFVPWEFTDTGQPSVNKNVLKVLAEAGGMQAEVVEALVRYKRNRKWKRTYVDRFLTSADRHGFVHPSVHTLAARTGRSSITGPPLQTLPSRDPMIRRCLLPPKGHAWYSLDFSNQEPRTLAHYGQSPALVKYFTEGDGTGSIHDFVAGEMFGAGYSPEQRYLAKVFGLSRSYGAGAEKIAVASGLPRSQVERLLPRYDELMGLERLNKAIEGVARRRQPQPYVVTSGGRRVYSDPEKDYTLVNFLMQGSGADMLKDAVIRMDDADLADFILLPVHDEVCFAFPTSEGAHLAEECRKLMEDDQFAVPMPVDIEGPAKSWGHVYEPEMA